MTATARVHARPTRARRHAARPVAVFVAVLALGVSTVVAALGLRPLGAANRCVAVLPEGTVVALDLEQSGNAALIAAVAVERGLPARAVTIALATALQESKLINIDYGDRDSLGLFQQRPSQGWGTPEQVTDPVYAANAFYDALVTVPDYQSLPVTEAAQAVQRSGYPEAYARHETRARAFASALTGNSPASLSCDLDVPPTATLEARLARDWGAAPLEPWTGPDGEEWRRVDVATLASAADGGTAAWSVGQWAVATAAATGASAVVVGDRLWQRGEDWIAAPPDLVQETGVVLVR